MTLHAVESHAEIRKESNMHEWTMQHPYLTFTLALFWILMLNNIIMGLTKSDAKNEEKSMNKSEKD